MFYKSSIAWFVLIHKQSILVIMRIICCFYLFAESKWSFIFGWKWCHVSRPVCFQPCQGKLKNLQWGSQYRQVRYSGGNNMLYWWRVYCSSHDLNAGQKVSHSDTFQKSDTKSSNRTLFYHRIKFRAKSLVQWGSENWTSEWSTIQKPDIFVWFSNGIRKPDVFSVFWIVDHSETGHFWSVFECHSKTEPALLWTIKKPDPSGFLIPAVFGILNCPKNMLYLICSVIIMSDPRCTFNTQTNTTLPTTKCCTQN